MAVMDDKNQLLPLPLQQGKGTTFLRTCFNGINALSGVGILSIPYALSGSGWLSLSLLFIVALICWYTGLLLQRCMDSNPLIRTYPDIGGLAFGPKGHALVCLFMYLELYLVAVEFLILEGDNLDKLFPLAGLRVAGLKLGGKQGFVLLAALIILPTMWLRSLGALAYVSVGGVVASVTLVVCVLWVRIVDAVGFHEKGMLLDWSGIPRTTSLYAFCCCGHAMFPTLCNSMKDRSQFSKVLLVCFITSTVTYGSMVVLGYLMYGQHLRSQVTLNLPDGGACHPVVRARDGIHRRVLEHLGVDAAALPLLPQDIQGGSDLRVRAGGDRVRCGDRDCHSRAGHFYVTGRNHGASIRGKQIMSQLLRKHTVKEDGHSGTFCEYSPNVTLDD